MYKVYILPRIVNEKYACITSWKYAVDEIGNVLERTDILGLGGSVLRFGMWSRRETPFRDSMRDQCEKHEVETREKLELFPANLLGP